MEFKIPTRQFAKKKKKKAPLLQTIKKRSPPQRKSKPKTQSWSLHKKKSKHFMFSLIPYSLSARRPICDDRSYRAEAPIPYLG